MQQRFEACRSHTKGPARPDGKPRGPTSILYGQGNPGGIVNISTKRPLDKFGFAVEGLLSTDKQRRVTIDATGPLSKSIGVRFNGVYENSDSFRDFVQNKRLMAAPTIRFSATDKLVIDVDYVFDRFEFTADRGGGSFSEIFENIPRSRNLGEPWLPLSRSTVHALRGQLEFRLAKDWRVRLGGAYFNAKTSDQSEIGFFPGPIEDTTLTGRYYIVTDAEIYDRTLTA